MNDRLPHEKGFHVSWDQIHRDARALAWRLDGHGPDDGAWRAVVGITRGGLVPAMIVSRELDIRVVDTISVKSYNHQEQMDAIVTKAPQAELMGDGTGILVVDDLADMREVLSRALVRRGHRVISASDGARGQIGRIDAALTFDVDSQREACGTRREENCYQFEEPCHRPAPVLRTAWESGADQRPGRVAADCRR